VKRKTKLAQLHDAVELINFRPIVSAPADGKNMIVICEDGKVGIDSLTHYVGHHISKQTGLDDGGGWSWYHASKSRRVLWCRPGQHQEGE
jgi:hypothetical protein